MNLSDKKHLVSPTGTLPGRNTLMPVAILYTVSGCSMASVSDGMEIAIFVVGCFWGTERLLWQLPGVHSTAAVYTSGYTPSSTYQEVRSGDTGHAEAVRIVYDPPAISYEQLLQVFWENHDPAQRMRQGNDHNTQYRSAIYPLIPGQNAATRVSLERFQTAMFAVDDDCRTTTEIASATPFHHAEDDHQQYPYKNPYGYCETGGIGVCLLPEAQRYGYKCRLLIKCILFIPDTA